LSPFLKEARGVNKQTLSGLPLPLRDLLERMEEEMVLRGFTRDTRRVYLAHIRRFYQERNWPTAGDEADLVVDSNEVRRWLLHLMGTGRSHSYTNQALSAIRFLHRAVLRAPAPVSGIPRAKQKKALPKVLSEDEVRRFLAALKNPKHRAIAFVLYSAGLRVSEAARLKVSDIDSDRCQIHVPQGKGRKDRYVMLSSVVLSVLREYARIERPSDWILPAGHRRDRHHRQVHPHRLARRAKDHQSHR